MKQVHVTARTVAMMRRANPRPIVGGMELPDGSWLIELDDDVIDQLEQVIATRGLGSYSEAIIHLCTDHMNEMIVKATEKLVEGELTAAMSMSDDVEEKWIVSVMGTGLPHPITVMADASHLWFPSGYMEEWPEGITRVLEAAIHFVRNAPRDEILMSEL